MDETTNSQVNIEAKEIELFIIASRHIKSKIKIAAKIRDKVFALVKDSLRKPSKWKILKKTLELLQASHYLRCNNISNRTCMTMTIPKHSSISKVSTSKYQQHKKRF